MKNESEGALDPIDMLLVISNKMQQDNNWLVDKLAEMEDEKSRLVDKSGLHDALNPDTKKIKELLDQTLSC